MSTHYRVNIFNISVWMLSFVIAKRLRYDRLSNNHPCESLKSLQSSLVKAFWKYFLSYDTYDLLFGALYKMSIECAFARCAVLSCCHLSVCDVLHAVSVRTTKSPLYDIGNITISQFCLQYITSRRWSSCLGKALAAPAGRCALVFFRRFLQIVDDVRLGLLARSTC